MKIIDQTPFLSEDGEIGLLDQVKATWQFGTSWLPEIKAQKVVIPLLSKGLPKGYVLLRNVPLPGTGVSIPFILVGPTGMSVLYVTHLRGIYRAKGDAWGKMEGSTFKPSRTNLLTHTARLARALQVFLQRQGYSTLEIVEGVLLCTDPGMHVDSVRPIVRVVLHDALERFALSVSQSRVVFSSEAVHAIVDRILNPRRPQSQAPVAAAEVEPAEAAPGISEEPAPETAFEQPWDVSRLGFEFHEEAAPEIGGELAVENPFAPASSADEASAPILDLSRPSSPPPSIPRRRGFSARQWVFTVIFVGVEIIIILVFAYLLLSNQY